MIKIAIVEDDEKDALSLGDCLKRYANEKNLCIEISRFKTADAFLFDYKKNFDLIFMDIMMPGTNGMESAKRLREIDQDTILIFVTTIARMAIQGYEVGALDFVIKPIEYPSFSLKLDRAFSKIKKDSGKTIAIKTKDGFETVKEDDIIFVEVSNHKVIYHLLSKNIETYSSLKSVQVELSDKKFYKTNNCYLVNMAYITKVDGYDLILNDKINLPISHPKRAEFIKTYHRFIMGE